ncbi:MAG: LolA family protein [Desulfosudaceae bacterium]
MILKRLEKRYDKVGFTARFTQTSTLKAMDIKDTASGRAFFKRPGKMRWEYEEPTPQQIITDGERLWIYKPEENQVVVGKAPTLFGKGGGVDLLTQIKKIPEQFTVERVPDPDQQNTFQLELTPRQETKNDDVAALYLTISRDSFDLVEIQTVSPYEDTTTIAFQQIEFVDQMDDKRFSFEIPLEADVITLDNQQQKPAP